MSRNDVGIDVFKERTLRRLKDKGEERRAYAIGPEHLLHWSGCALCGATPLTRLAEVYLPDGLNFLSTAVCPNCLFTFRDVAPAYPWFKRCWQIISEKKREVFNPAIEAIRRQRYERYYDLLSEYAHDGTVLDLGAGYGTGASVFRDHGCRTEAVEPEDDKAFYIHECLKIPVYETAIETFIAEKRKYRLVLFVHCLEHLDDPVSVMSHLRDSLDPECGTLYLEVPVLWESVNWSDALYLTHKSNFTEENVEDLALNSGFEVLKRVRYQASATEPWNFGMVLKPASGAQSRNLPYRRAEGRTVADVRRLYRDKLPLQTSLPPEAVIRYRVPHIEHFYQTVRLDSKKLRPDAADPRWINICPRENS